MEIVCDYCGKKFNYKSGEVHFKRSKKHYCSLKCLCTSNIKYGKKTRKWKEYGLWLNAKRRAKKKGLEFNLSFLDMPKIPEYCPILGIQIKANYKAGPTDSSPSVDRIDNNKGYIVGNIRVISNRANRLRQDGTLEEWKLLIKDAKNL